MEAMLGKKKSDDPLEQFCKALKEKAWKLQSLKKKL